MNRPIGPPLLHCLQILAAVVDNLVVDDLDLAGCRQGGHQTRNRVHDQSRLALALPLRLFGALTFRNLVFQSFHVRVLQAYRCLVRGGIQRRLSLRVGKSNRCDPATRKPISPRRPRRADPTDRSSSPIETRERAGHAKAVSPNAE